MSYTIHVAGPAKILDATALSIPQIEGQSVDLGNAPVVVATAGSPYPTFSGLMAVHRRFSLSSAMVGQLLNKITAKGLILATGFEMYNQLVDDTTGLRAGASSHEKLAIATGIILPRTLTVQQDAPAKLAFDVIGVNAGGATDPLVKTASQTLPTTAEVSELFTMGPIKVNGSALEGIQSWSLDFGLREVVKKHSGVVYDQRVHIEMVAPRISFKTDDAATLATLGLLGLEQTATDSVLYLRKLDEGGTRVADNVAEHLSFTIDEGLWLVNNKGGDHPTPLGTDALIQPTYDGSVDPVVFARNVVIA